MARVRLVRRSQLSGMIPAAMIPTVRSVFTSQGITASAVDDNGNIDPQAIIALVYDSVEFRSRLFPPGSVTYNLKNTESSPQTRALLKAVQPAVILHSAQYGDKVLFAPLGVPTAQATEVTTAASNIGFGVGAVALGLVLAGVAISRRRR
jgi:hypothetical protein